MKHYTTGEVAAELRTSEPRINDLIRRGKIAPAPSVRGGRRFWLQVDIERAARALGVHVGVNAEMEATNAS